MRCPTLAELPPPPAGKTGWPWTVETPQLPPMRPDGSPWPRISIVTPNYNYGHFVEETIRSVLLQGYPDLEYIIIDGGSSDESVAIIKKYEPWLAYWVSEKDRGQAHAINKGLSKVTGSIFNWINSDDLLVHGALATVGARAKGACAVAGGVVNFGAGAPTLIANSALSPAQIISGAPETGFQQPGFWWVPANIVTAGGIDADLNCAFDLDLLVRYLLKFPQIAYATAAVAAFRLHPDSKTSSQQKAFDGERLAIYRKLLCNTACRSVHEHCRYRLRLHAWWDRLARIANSGRPRLLRAGEIGAAMCGDPVVRFSRLSVGAIRRILFCADERPRPGHG